MRSIFCILFYISLSIFPAIANDVQTLESFYYEIDDIEKSIFDAPKLGREQLLHYKDAVEKFPSEAALAYYNQLVLSYAYAQEYEAAYKEASRVKRQYYRKEPSKQYALLLLNKAYAAGSMGKASLDELLSVYEYGMETGDAEVMYLANMILGEYYSKRDNIIQAHGHIVDAVDYAMEMKGRDGQNSLAGTYFMLADLNRKMERPDEVIKFGMKAASMYRDLGDIASVAVVQSLTSYVLITEKKYNEAISNIEETLQEIEENNIDYLRSSPIYLLAFVNYELGKSDVALDLLNEIRVEVVEQGLLGDPVLYHNLYMRVLLQLNKIDDAQDYFTEFLGSPDEIKSIDRDTEILYGKIDAVESYAMLLESQGALPDAIETWKLFTDLRIAHLQRKRSSAIQEYLVKHAVEYSNKQSENLAKETKIKKLELEKMKKEMSNNEILMWLGVAITVLIAGIVVNQNVIRKRLKKIVDTDSLTGVGNRKLLMDFGKRHFDKKETELGSVIMLDIDKFKSINDQFGHDVGDAVLVAFAEVASKQVRDVDAFGRYGGEEFVTILPKANYEEAMAVAGRIVVAMSQFDWSSVGLDRSVTASIGVASKRHWDQDFSELLKESDDAMYYVKERTRNGIKHFHDI